MIQDEYAGLSGAALARRVFASRQINQAGCDLVKSFEGLRVQSYLCPAGIWTIGYGHTRTARPNMVVTREQADWLLTDDLRQAARVVMQQVTVTLNDNQFAALVCFVFNVGAQNFSQSTLLRLLQRGWYEQVPVQLVRWNKARGETLGGLARRRAAEAKLWNQTINASSF